MTNAAGKGYTILILMNLAQFLAKLHIGIHSKLQNMKQKYWLL